VVIGMAGSRRGTGGISLKSARAHCGRTSRLRRGTCQPPARWPLWPAKAPHHGRFPWPAPRYARGGAPAASSGLGHSTTERAATAVAVILTADPRW